MRKTISLTCLILTICLSIQAQHNEEKQIIAAINQIFDGMREGDSSKVSAVLHPQIEMATVVKNKEGKTQLIKSKDASGWLTAIAQPKDEIWDERISNEIIQVDGNMAAVWCEYVFYRGEKLSHCGVNSFNLAKLNGKWQIVQVIDTRRTDNCN